MTTYLLDTNLIIRFLLEDNPKLFQKAKDIFHQAEKGQVQLYIDEAVIAETIWVLSSFYKYSRKTITSKLNQLLSQKWVQNPKKKILINTLGFYEKHNLAYVDCWILALSQSKPNLTLKTFDKSLKKLIK